MSKLYDQDLDYDLGDCFFMMMPNYTVEPSSGKYQIPFVYATSANATGNADVEVVYNYENNATVTDADINIPYSCAVIGVEEKGVMLEGVSQNTPNPCWQSTSFTVALKQPAQINISVYNTMGQHLLSKVSNGTQGDNQVVLDLANLSSGVYSYTVQVEGRTVSKKLIIEK